MNMNISRRRRTLAAIGGSIVLITAACGSDDDTAVEAAAPSAAVDACAELTLENGFVRLPPAENTAAYVDITNGTGADVTLTSASTDLGGMVELHEMRMDDEGVMSMSEVPGGIAVPDGETVSLEPGGLHVMIMGVSRDVAEGEMVDVGFEFSNGCSTELSLPVQLIAGMTATDDHSEHGHSEEDHSDHSEHGNSDEDHSEHDHEHTEDSDG